MLQHCLSEEAGAAGQAEHEASTGAIQADQQRELGRSSCVFFHLMNSSRIPIGLSQEVGTLWIHSVPQEIVNSVSETEKKRQEAINEVIYTERDFVRDLEYLRDVSFHFLPLHTHSYKNHQTWVTRIQESDVIPAERRKTFIQQVFWNTKDIIAVNTRLRDALSKRQKSYAVVDRIGDIFLEHVPHFGPFVAYGAHQLYGKYEFEREKGQNPAFAAFVEVNSFQKHGTLDTKGYFILPDH